jgi:anti-anti-sigma factor
MAEPTDRFVVQDRGTDAVVVVRGDIDRTTAGLLREALEAALAIRHPLVLLDLSGVSYVDSSGLSVIVRARRTLVRDQRLALCNVPGRMKRVLEVTSVDTLFGVHALGERWPWDDVRPVPPGTPASPPA